MLEKTAYTSTYSSMWSNRVRSGGYLGRLLITYSSASLSFTPLDSLIFLLDFTDPCLVWHFGALQVFGSELSDRGQWKVDWSLPSSMKCLAASFQILNYSCMREVWYRSRGRWCSFISRNTNKLLWKSRIIRMNRKIFFGMGQGMVFPSGGTIPLHLRVMFKTTIETC